MAEALSYSLLSPVGNAQYINTCAAQSPKNCNYATLIDPYPTNNKPAWVALAKE